MSIVQQNKDITKQNIIITFSFIYKFLLIFIIKIIINKKDKCGGRDKIKWVLGNGEMACVCV